MPMLVSASSGDKTATSTTSDIRTSMSKDPLKTNESPFPFTIQTKLTVGSKDDPLEEEADNMANQVMRMPENSFIQRKCHECEKEDQVHRTPLTDSITPQIQAKGDGNFSVNEASASSIKATLGSGSRLDKHTNNFMSERFGHNFNDVKIHNDSHSAQLNTDLHAKAFTVGKDIYFNQNQYDPESDSGKKLLAHELTHVVQQNELASTNKSNASDKLLQADFAVEPTTPSRDIPVLTAQQIQDAITYNQARHTDAAEIGLLRDILGISQVPQVIDDDFINALVSYQTQYGLSRDGRLGHDTADRLAREIIAESDFLGAGNLGNMAPEFALQTAIQTLIGSNNKTYADYRAAILNATMIQQHVSLRNQQLLRDIRGQLSWNNWARCIELLGRRAPSYAELTESTVVRGALRRAWTDSTPSVPGPGTTQHEEGGWIYLNLNTDLLSIRRAATGAGASINLDSPPNVAESVVVGMFHTHPNLGIGWTPGPSPNDITLDTRDGVPDIVVGCPSGDIRRTQFFLSGPARRQHLAGNRGLPGAAGGLAPQAKADGTLDKR